MRVLLLTDELFASREQSLLARIEVGYADEGVRVAHAIPDSVVGKVSQLAGAVFAKQIVYEPGRFIFARALRRRKLVAALKMLVSEDDDHDDVDIIHVFGGGAWDLGAELAEDLNARLVLEVWRSGMVSRAANTKWLLEVPPMFIAPDAMIERSLKAANSALNVRLCPWGVHAAIAERKVLPVDKAPAAVVVGTGQDSKAFSAAFEGLARVIKEFPEFMLFMDASAASKSGAWALARKWGLAKHISLVDEIESRRDLLMHADFLVQPEARGDQRTIVLDAMAARMLVIAGADPMVSILADGKTARLIARPDGNEWYAAIAGLLKNQSEAQRLADAAHDCVRDQRRASEQIRLLLQSYATTLPTQAFPFAPSATSSSFQK